MFAEKVLLRDLWKTLYLLQEGGPNRQGVEKAFDLPVGRQVESFD
ncbi:MAG: hypothetical protein ABSH06_25180 [Thermodesulfobacteriota bacterium]|jgi:hypothetical protein